MRATLNDYRNPVTSLSNVIVGPTDPTNDHFQGNLFLSASLLYVGVQRNTRGPSVPKPHSFGPISVSWCPGPKGLTRRTRDGEDRT